MTSADKETTKLLEAFTQFHKKEKVVKRFRETYMQALIEKIKSMRVEKGVTLQKLADESKVSRSHIINVLYNGLKTLTPAQAKAMIQALTNYGKTTERMGKES